MYYLGLDLGRRDHTAMAVVEKMERAYQSAGVAALHLRHVERVPLGTTYQEVVERVREVVSNQAISGQSNASTANVARPGTCWQERRHVLRCEEAVPQSRCATAGLGGPSPGQRSGGQRVPGRSRQSGIRPEAVRHCQRTCFAA